MAIVESKERDELIQKYRRVFNTPEGREVVLDIVLDLGVFDTISPENKERVALRNYGLSLMANLGILLDDNLKGIIDGMMAIEYKPLGDRLKE